MTETSFKADLTALVKETLTFLLQDHPKKITAQENPTQNTLTIKPTQAPTKPVYAPLPTPTLPQAPTPKLIAEEKKSINSEVAPEHKKDPLGLEPLKSAPIDSFEDVKTWIQTISSIAYVAEPLSDALAIKIREDWKHDKKLAPVVIISSNDTPATKSFLAQVAQAITLHFYPCDLIDAQEMQTKNAWQNVLEIPDKKLYIAAESAMIRYPELALVYKEKSGNKGPFLGTTPLLIVPDFALYLQQPSLKASLWSTLCYLLQ
ncbi:MAG: hypothetical protein JHC93_02835 [Parachlamydiales bacterium]|nr:hypothetical protein [Parachlamydiales bacterium]